MAPQRKKNGPAKQVLIILTVVFFALSVVYFVVLYAHPNRVFMDNIILNLIVEKHTPQGDE